MQVPHPVQAAPSTGRPRSSILRAASPAGQTRAQTPHSTSRKAIQRSLSIAILDKCIDAHKSSGTVSASVGQTVAQGILTHITQAVTLTSTIGVPARSPWSVPSVRIASAGQAFSHSPHLVQAARKVISGSAPGGRVNSLNAPFFSTTSTAFPSTRRNPEAKNARRSSGVSDIAERYSRDRSSHPLSASLSIRQSAHPARCDQTKKNRE